MEDGVIGQGEGEGMDWEGMGIGGEEGIGGGEGGLMGGVEKEDFVFPV